MRIIIISALIHISLCFLLLKPNRLLNYKMNGDDDLSSIEINNLLTKAIKLASSQIESVKNSTSLPGIREEVVLEFNAGHTESISFPNIPKALKYLSLPISSYSVLNSKLFQRISNDTFQFKLSLYEFTSMTPFQINANLLTNIKVNSNPELGLISMKSGELYFIPIKSDRSNNSYGQSTTSIVSNRSNTFDDQYDNETGLPNWIIRKGGFGTTSPAPNDSMLSSEQDSKNILSDIRNNNNAYNGSTVDAMDVVTESIVVTSTRQLLKPIQVTATEATTSVRRSAIQAGVEISIRYPPKGKTDRIASGSAMLRSLLSFRQRYFAAPQESNDRESNDRESNHSLLHINNDYSPVQYNHNDDDDDNNNNRNDKDIKIVNINNSNQTNGVITNNGYQIVASDSTSRNTTTVDDTVISNDTNSSILLAKANVRVNVQLYLNLPIEIARVINFLPVRVLIERAGALTVLGILRTMGPTLSNQLLIDYNKRNL